jgi:maltose/maltodextrin transport system substrate-binding protein
VATVKLLGLQSSVKSVVLNSGLIVMMPGMLRQLVLFLAVFLIQTNLFAWKNGELLIWMDDARARGLQSIAKKVEKDLGIKITIETPENITYSFPIASQMGQGPDVVIWAHDKIGEWADGGLISPVEVSNEFEGKFSKKSWQAVLHRDRFWGYPIAMETVTLIYNKRLLEGPPPKDLSGLSSINTQMKAKHPGVATILWDSESAYYSWGILASAGGYVFGTNGKEYDLKNVGVANPGAVDGLSQIVALIRAGILPKHTPYSTVESEICRNKAAMIISGPWAWPNLTKSGIDFGLAPMPGVNGKPGRPFIGVTVAYINRSSANSNLAPYFIEHFLLTDEGLTAMNAAKPIGVPALLSAYQNLANDNPMLKDLNTSIDLGEIMPNIPQMGRFFSAVGTALQIATQGRASPQEALKDAAETLRAD